MSCLKTYLIDYTLEFEDENFATTWLLSMVVNALDEKFAESLAKQLGVDQVLSVTEVTFLENSNGHIIDTSCIPLN